MALNFGVWTVEEGHKLVSEFLPEALFQALTLSSTQGDNSKSSTPVVGELIVIKL